MLEAFTCVDVMVFADTFSAEELMKKPLEASTVWLVTLAAVNELMFPWDALMVVDDTFPE